MLRNLWLFIVLFIMMKLSACGGSLDKVAIGHADMGAMNQMTKSSVEANKRRNNNRKEDKQKNLPKARTLYLSADDSNSTASPVIARKMILSGKYVQPDIIRTYEFLNYYTFDYNTPLQNDIEIIPQLRKKEKANEYSMQVAIRSKNKSFQELPRFNITFMLDISGSMSGKSIELAKKFIIDFTKKLRQGDIISIVTCNRDTKVILDSHQVGQNTQSIINEKIPNVSVNDISNIEKGIEEAYSLAKKNYNYRYMNRVIVLSDGAANAGKLSIETISDHAKDTDKQGIYLVGVGLGEGFNDQLMNAFTDKGRGAYLFIDSNSDIQHALSNDNFIANFDLAVKDVRLKMVMPEGWEMVEFHGEQVSTVASEVIPQYLAPNDQMIYHLTLSNKQSQQNGLQQSFEFEAEYTPIGQNAKKLSIKRNVAQMISDHKQIYKGDAIVEYAELLKKIKYPLNNNKDENLKNFNQAYQVIQGLSSKIQDSELSEIIALLNKYKQTITLGEQFQSRDKNDQSIGAVLGISPNDILDISIIGSNSKVAVKTLERLGQSVKLVPMEGYRFLALSSGPVGNPSPAGSGSLENKLLPDPKPKFMGFQEYQGDKKPVYDLHKVVLKLKAPKDAKSFTFDFNFFSAEYPNFIKQNFNDTFYAIIEAESTNNGSTTNISFDSNHNSIEVDNNYFENEFHPIPNTGTGFDYHGSTGWLRTSWPIKGGEVFTLTFSIHDEGDAIYDSLVIIDNFQWHKYEAVGTTDPLN